MSEFTDKFTKVGAGWRNKKGTGWNCKIEATLQPQTSLLIFEKKEKRNERQPDIELFVEKANLPSEPQHPEQPTNIDDDSVPF